MLFPGDVVMSTWVSRLIVMVIIGAALFVIPEQLNHLAEVTRLRSGTHGDYTAISASRRAGYHGRSRDPAFQESFGWAPLHPTPPHPAPFSNPNF